MNLTLLRALPIAIAALSCSVAAVHAADEKPVEIRAARSVHLNYVLPDAVKAGVAEFYNEVTPEKTTLGSYFQVCGFSGGYFGIQERGDKKVGIFSVWDTGKQQNDRNATAKENRVKTVFVGDGVRADRFGGEGTGGHSDFDCDWELGKTYKFYLRVTPKDQGTEYDAWFKDPANSDWKHVATFWAPDGGKKLKGLYSFIEDFRRDVKSVGEVRRATYGNGWVRDEAGSEWLPLLNARFTASGAAWEDKDHIDAGVVGTKFYLQTGGDTKMSRELRSTFTRPADPTDKVPALPNVAASK